jgi:dienelactone hydrolase
MRMDYRGIGESSGDRPLFDLADPFPEDVVAAVGWMRSEGIGDVALVGTCFGGRAALAAAGDLSGIRGVALFGSPVRDFRKGERIASQPVRWYLRKATDRRTLKQLGDPRKRRAYRDLLVKKLRHMRRGQAAPGERPAPAGVSPRFLAQLTALVDAGVPVLLVFGTDDAFLEDFERARTGPLGQLLDRAGDLVRVEILDGRVHGLTTRAGQDAMMRSATAWLEGLAAASRV